LKRIRSWKPIFVEDSKIPVILSHISPIKIWAINLVFFVFCRGKLTDKTKNHETIHYQQWIELLVIGFAFLYPMFWILNLLKKMNPADAYRHIPFEKEAYENEAQLDYLKARKRYAWTKYIKN